jgi:hypothetical protein
MSVYEPQHVWHIAIIEGSSSAPRGRVWEGYWPSIPPVGTVVSPLGLTLLEITEVLIPIGHDPRADATARIYVTDRRRASPGDPG